MLWKISCETQYVYDGSRTDWVDETLFVEAADYVSAKEIATQHILRGNLGGDGFRVRNVEAKEVRDDVTRIT